MADSFKFTPEMKTRGRATPTFRKPLEEMPKYKISDATPDVYDAIDTRDAYDVAFGDQWLSDLNPQQTLIVLKRARTMYMSEVNKIQKEIDRITLLEMDHTDPRAYTPWPRYYELRVKKERKRESRLDTQAIH